jgi:hexosaminidase
MRLIIKIGLIVLILIVAQCKEEKGDDKHFLKKGHIQLAQPMLSTNNTIINDSTTLIVGPVENGSKLYYTIEGSEPTEQSLLYDGPIKISKDCVVKVKAFHADWLTSEVSTIEFLKAGIKPVNINLLTELSQKYPGNGISTLIDNEKGTADFSDLRWIGINDSLSAIVDFGKPKNLHSLKVCFMTNTGAWIFPPKNITVSRSDDGINFEEFSSNDLEIPTAKTNSGIVHVTIKCNTKNRYIKVNVENLTKIPAWHEGRGEEAWVFMDEWIFN